MGGIAASHALRRDGLAVAGLAPVIVAAVLVLLAAACSSPSSTGSPQAGGSVASPSAVAYSACMRSHGLVDYPDPASGGNLPKGSAQQFGVSNSQLQAAGQACQHLLPTAGSIQQRAQQCFNTGDCPPALVQQVLSLERRFARCMRSHGVPDWPDPTLDSEGRPGFAISISSDGFSPDSQFLTQQDECGRLTGSPAPRAVSP